MKNVYYISSLFCIGCRWELGANSRELSRKAFLADVRSESYNCGRQDVKATTSLNVPCSFNAKPVQHVVRVGQKRSIDRFSNDLDYVPLLSSCKTSVPANPSNSDPTAEHHFSETSQDAIICSTLKNSEDKLRNLKNTSSSLPDLINRQSGSSVNDVCDKSLQHSKDNFTTFKDYYAGNAFMLKTPTYLQPLSSFLRSYSNVPSYSREPTFSPNIAKESRFQDMLNKVHNVSQNTAVENMLNQNQIDSPNLFPYPNQQLFSSLFPVGRSPSSAFSFEDISKNYVPPVPPTREPIENTLESSYHNRGPLDHLKPEAPQMDALSKQLLEIAQKQGLINYVSDASDTNTPFENSFSAALNDYNIVIDEKDKRKKNNEAAKRSRDARRRKEDETALKAALLTLENKMLREKIDKMVAVVADLRVQVTNSFASK